LRCGYPRRTLPCTWLREQLVEKGRPTSGAMWDGDPPATAVNVAFTYRGLEEIGVAPRWLGTFPDEFRTGMYDRPLGDPVGKQQPPLKVRTWQKRWYACDGRGTVEDEAGETEGAVHLLLMVYSMKDDEGDQLEAELRSTAARHQLNYLGTTVAAVPGDKNEPVREHFGFRDAISQPVVAGVRYPSERSPDGRGAMVRRLFQREPEWRGLKPGEFVLGYPDEDLRSPPLPEPLPLVRSGSFLVYRRLRQDVPGFRKLTARYAAMRGETPEGVAAKLVGRWPDGKPLLPYKRGDENQFSFRCDRHGYGCPLGSHIRRANPRNGLDVDPSIVNRHRLIRRGMPYGPAYPVKAEQRHPAPPTVDRGIIFMAYVASISRQFEFVQRDWLGDANIFGQGHTRDVFAGPAASFTIQHEHDPLVMSPIEVVTTLGGEYFFQPGIRAIRLLTGEDRDRRVRLFDQGP
jgi:Dyp-type peroxidase family